MLSKQDRAMRAAFQGYTGMYRKAARKATGQHCELYRAQCMVEAWAWLLKARVYSTE